MSRFLVTGGLGFVGSSLIPKLISELGCKVTILDNLSNPSDDLAISREIKLIEGDIRNKIKVDEVMQDTDAVIHLAAHTRVTESIKNPLLNFDVNVQGTLNILESMRRNNAELIINASTGGAILGEIIPPVNEDMPAKPASPYGASKLAAEGYLSAYAQSYGIKAVSLRFSNLYGPFSRNKSSVVAAFIKDIVKSRTVTVYGDGTQTRDFLFVEDLVDGIMKAIVSGNSGVFQLGYGKPNSINELIAIFRSIVPYDFNVTSEDFRAGEIKHTYCDISKARKTFQYSPTTTLGIGVKRTWDWFSSK